MQQNRPAVFQPLLHDSTGEYFTCKRMDGFRLQPWMCSARSTRHCSSYLVHRNGYLAFEAVGQEAPWPAGRATALSKTRFSNIRWPLRHEHAAAMGAAPIGHRPPSSSSFIYSPGRERTFTIASQTFFHSQLSQCCSSSLAQYFDSQCSSVPPNLSSNSLSVAAVA
jgi:hypothetical protein